MRKHFSKDSKKIEASSSTGQARGQEGERGPRSLVGEAQWNGARDMYADEETTQWIRDDDVCKFEVYSNKMKYSVRLSWNCALLNSILYVFGKRDF